MHKLYTIKFDGITHEACWCATWPNTYLQVQPNRGRSDSWKIASLVIALTLEPGSLRTYASRLATIIAPSEPQLARIQRWQEFPERNSRTQAKNWSSGFGACTWSISEQRGYVKSPDSALETMQLARVLLQRWWQRRKTRPFWTFGDNPSGFPPTGKVFLV